MIKRLSVRVLKIIHNPKVTQKDPRRSPRANLNTVITSIDVELINESIELTSNPFNKLKPLQLELKIYSFQN